MTRMQVLLLPLALLLAGCGVDGAPTPPEPKQAPVAGVRISGDAYMGVVVANP